MADDIKGMQLRTVLHSAFSFVRATETNRATSAITLDHLLQERVTSIQKDKLPALDDLEKKLKSVVEAIEKAGTDAERLKQLGIYEVDKSDVWESGGEGA